MSPNRTIRPLVAADRSGVFRILEGAGNFTPEEVATALDRVQKSRRKSRKPTSKAV